MKPGTELTAIHPAVEAGVNNRDIDGLMALYAEDASMVLVDGSIVTGLSAIREEWSGLLAMNGHLTLRSRFAIAAGDLAVLSCEWTFEVGGEQISSVTAEVARRQPDRGWLYVIDHPYAGSEPDELATIKATMEAPATWDWAHDTGADLAKTNVNGGAIAIGHPLGASGARIMTTLVNALEQRGGRYGLQTMCEGGGMANATIIERLD